MQAVTLATLATLTLLALLHCSSAAPMSGESQYNPRNEVAIELMDALNRILRDQELVEQNEQKRGLDLGLSRGFSGAGAAKHLMGLAAANFAGGPGRRRRSVSPSMQLAHH